MDWQEESARVRLQSEAFSFNETQHLMRHILKMWFLCTSCVSTILVPMYCKLNAFKTYRHMIICPSALFLLRFFYWEFSSRQGHWTSPSLLPTGLWCSVVSPLLPAPSSCLVPLDCSLGLGSAKLEALSASSLRRQGSIPAWPEEMGWFPPQSCTEVNPQEQDGSKYQLLTSLFAGWFFTMCN